MIYNFCNERALIPKYDAGDIGEFFRISQYWVMYGTVGRTSHTTRITGTIHIDTSIFHSSDDFGNTNLIEKKVDLLHFMSTGRLSDPMPLLTTEKIDIPDNEVSSMIAASPYLTTIYPSARWERALDTLSKYSFLYRSLDNVSKDQQQKQRLHYFGNALCRLINTDLHRVSQQTINKDEQRISLLSWLPHFDTLQQKHRQNVIWMMNDTNTDTATRGITNNNVQQQKLSKQLIYVSEIEIRFQHLELISEERELRKVSSDFVITVPCRLD